MPNPTPDNEARRADGGAFAFGDQQWPGVAKLAEECGEVIQVIGKLLMTHGDRAHWSGDLGAMMFEETADVQAALHFYWAHNLNERQQALWQQRVTDKIEKFEMWHADMDADPPPSLHPGVHP